MSRTTPDEHPPTCSDDYLEECRKALSEEQAASLSATDHWRHVDREKAHSDWDALYRKLAAIIDTAAPTSAEAQELIREHYLVASRFYVPSKAAYIGMSLFYASNDAMRDFHNQYHPEMVRFLGPAILEYAERQL
jgi:hypothetical protein